MGSVAQTSVAEAPPTVTGAGVADANGDGLLVRAARPVLDVLAGDLAGTRIGVVLSDAGGQLVDRRVSEPWLGVQPDFPHVTGPVTPIADLRTGRTMGTLELTCLVKRRCAKGPFVLVTARRLIPNAAADRLVDPDDEPALRKAADRLCDRIQDDVTTIVLSGRAVAVRAMPVLDDEPPGIGLELTPLVTDTGHSSRRRDRTSCGWASLTDTERSVAHVVAEGLTNREAAERLFLSPHTVDFHLRSIFRKLGTNSRVHLTRLVILAQHAQGEP
jgi:DNA-binding CsgD family transcriptional regulator